MFKVKEKGTNNVYTVYHISNDTLALYFLIYSKEDDFGWIWVDSENYEPYEESTRPIEPSYVPVPYYYPVPSTTPTDDWWKNPTVTWQCNAQPPSVS